MKKNAIKRLVLNTILTIFTIGCSLFSIIIIKDFLWGTVEGWDGLAGIIVFPLSLIGTGLLIIFTIFNITSLIFCLHAKQKSEIQEHRKYHLAGIIISAIGILIGIFHIIFMFIELIIKK